MNPRTSVVFFVVAMVAMTVAYPTGAPEEACVTMVPNHPVTTTSGQPPFKITLSSSSYKPGSEITGSISSPNMAKFRGFLLQARAPGGQNATAPVGQFINPVSDSKTVCGQGDMQGLTHTNNTDKTSVTFTWKAPATSAGDLVFQLTVVESYSPSRYWLKIMSGKVSDCFLNTSSADCSKHVRKSKIQKKMNKSDKVLRFQKKHPNST